MKTITKEKLIRILTNIFENEKRIHENNKPVDWLKIAICKTATYLSLLLKEEELKKCYNCGDKVKMVSKGEFCPNCGVDQ